MEKIMQNHKSNESAPILGTFPYAAVGGRKQQNQIQGVPEGHEAPLTDPAVGLFFFLTLFFIYFYFILFFGVGFMKTERIKHKSGVILHHNSQSVVTSSL